MRTSVAVLAAFVTGVVGLGAGHTVAPGRLVPLGSDSARGLGPIVVRSIDAGPSTCWLPPVDAPVSDPYRSPACPYCAGNRGVDFATGAGVPVRAVATGRVTFAGPVGGIGYVVLRHADGRRATYGGVHGSSWRVGEHVPAGAVVGRTTHDLHFGIRDVDGEYEDPTPLLGRAAYRWRLLPLHGDEPRPAPPPRARCSAPRGG